MDHTYHTYPDWIKKNATINPKNKKGNKSF